ncbi:MAG: GTP-binding protein [Gammaproteobacteria bacterium]|nr:GTP-binding protein [Gammaproteobacteria bacterium]
MKNDLDEFPIHKIVILGDTGTGKSSLIKRFVHNIFSMHYSKNKDVNFAMADRTHSEGWKATPCKLRLWDVPGDQLDSINLGIWMKEARAIILCFDLERPKTLTNLEQWLKKCPQGLPIILVGTKSDLVDDIQDSTREDARQFGVNNELPYLETSAKNDVHLDALFEAAVEMIPLQKNDNESDNENESDIANDAENSSFDPQSFVNELLEKSNGARIGFIEQKKELLRDSIFEKNSNNRSQLLMNFHFLKQVPADSNDAEARAAANKKAKQTPEVRNLLTQYGKARCLWETAKERRQKNRPTPITANVKVDAEKDLMAQIAVSFHAYADSGLLSLTRHNQQNEAKEIAKYFVDNKSNLSFTLESYMDKINEIAGKAEEKEGYNKKGTFAGLVAIANAEALLHAPEPENTDENGTGYDYYNDM